VSHRKLSLYYLIIYSGIILTVFFFFRSYEHYTTEAYVEDLVALLQRYRSDDTVLICHSYGCAIGALLYQRMPQSIKGIVMIGPKALVTPHEQESKTKLAKTPDWAVNLARKVDRIGGIHSQSVNRLVHSSASDDLRRKQLRWNKESKTFVLKRLMAGVHFPTQHDFCKIQCPLLLLAGEDVSPSSCVVKPSLKIILLI